MFVPFRAATALFLALTMVLTACGVDRTAPQSSPQAPEASSAQGAESPSGDTQFPQVLIAYFSLWENADWSAYADANSSASVVVEDGRSTGTTAYIAELIHTAVGGELYPITISEPYPADFDAVVDQNHQETEPPRLPAQSRIYRNMMLCFLDIRFGQVRFRAQSRHFLLHVIYPARRSFRSARTMATGPEAASRILLRWSRMPMLCDPDLQWIPPKPETHARRFPSGWRECTPCRWISGSRPQSRLPQAI